MFEPAFGSPRVCACQKTCLHNPKDVGDSGDLGDFIPTTAAYIGLLLRFRY